MANAVTKTQQLDRFHELALLGMWSSGVAALAFSTLTLDIFLLVAILGILLRFVLTIRGTTLNLTPALVDVLTILYAALYPYDLVYGSKDFVLATIHLVLSLGTLRFISAKSDRDLFFVKILSFMAILAAALVSANLSFLIFLGISVIFTVATFASSEIRRASLRPNVQNAELDPRFSRTLRNHTLGATFTILLCALLIFFILPRTARAAISRFIPNGMRITGFSNEVRLGAIGELQQRRNLVFHAKLDESADGLSIDGARLKWRGAALAHFDGKRWFNRNRKAEVLMLEHGLLRLGMQGRTNSAGQRFHYEVQLAGISSDALFLAGYSEFLRVPTSFVYRVNGNNFRLPSPTWEHLRYEADTFLDALGGDGSGLDEEQRMEHLEVPGADRRVMQLAQEIAAPGKSPIEQAKLIEQWLRKTFPYSLELPKVESADPIANFLFERKKGHCEYFASSMAVMLRLNGIPSRIVTGFQGGEWNPVSGWYQIRSSDAHSWVEAWFPLKGWVVFDPTPSSPALPKNALWLRATQYLDAAELFWQDWVMNFDSDRQGNLSLRLEMASRALTLPKWSLPQLDRNTFSDAWPSVVGLIGLGSLLVLFPKLLRAFRQWRQTKRFRTGAIGQGDATKLYLRLETILAKQGFQRSGDMTPIEFSEVLPAPICSRVRLATENYNKLRFGQDTGAGLELLTQLDELESDVSQLRSVG